MEGTDLCLAGTAEILMGGLYMDRIIEESSLPLKLAAFSHCFRTEAGAAGSATRFHLICFKFYTRYIPHNLFCIYQSTPSVSNFTRIAM